MKKVVLVLALAVLIIPHLLLGQSRMPKESYNWLQNAYPLAQGNIDRVNVVFYEVPDTVTSTLFFAVRDPGCDGASQAGGGYDADGVPDQDPGGTTTFYLIGGPGALSNPDSRQVRYTTPADARAGTVLDSFSRSSQADNSGAPPDYGWVYFTGVSPMDGEHIGNKYYFKVVVEAGTDAPVYKNAYQLDVGTGPTGAPGGVAGVRTFAYSWSVALLDAGTIWNIYPFVPQGATGNLLIHNWDFDTGESMEIFDISGVSQGAVAVSGYSTSYPADVVTVSKSLAAATDPDNGTWNLQITENGEPADMAVNTAEVWFTNSDTGELYRAYAEHYEPPPPDTVASNVDDGMALADGVTTETLLLQIVDGSGEPLPYKRNLYVTVDGSAELAASSDTTAPLPAGSALITTDADGLAWVTIRDAVQETIQVTVYADGTGGSHNLGASRNSHEIVFHAPGFSALDHFTFTVQPPVEAWSGVPFSVTIEARDASNNLTSAFSGTVAVEDLSGTASPGLIDFTGGRFTGNLAVSPGAYTGDVITVRYGVRTGQSAAFDVQEAPSGIRNNVINPERGDLAYITFTVGSSTTVRCRVYDLAGNPVAKLAGRTFPAGAHTITWNGRNKRGISCMRGVYYVLLQAGGSRTVYKVLVVR